jgi:hypothetical protein
MEVSVTLIPNRLFPKLVSGLNPSLKGCRVKSELILFTREIGKIIKGSITSMP